MQNTGLPHIERTQMEAVAKPRAIPVQLRFFWPPKLFEHDCPSSTVRRTRFQHLSWPPQVGEKIAFWTNLGIGTGVLREIRQGLACPQYHMTDGRIVMQHELLLSPDTTQWRDPDTVSEQELKACAARINAAHDAAPGIDLRLLPEAWADICQYVAHTAAKSAKEDERRKSRMMEIKPNIPPA
jgi:hypothetical protein